MTALRTVTTPIENSILANACQGSFFFLGASCFAPKISLQTSEPKELPFPKTPKEPTETKRQQMAPKYGSAPSPLSYSFTTLISYPISTSVLLPSQPRVPAELSMNRAVGSMYRLEMTPARGGPGMMRKGTVECLAVLVSRRSHSRRMSCEALKKSRVVS